MALRAVSLDDLTIDDEPAFAALPIYTSLKRALAQSGHRFLVPAAGTEVGWDRTVFLNLTFWSAETAGGDGAGADVLGGDAIPADVVAHAAWHHVVARAIAADAGGGSPAPEGLFLAEAIASAFDLYLVGRLMRQAPGCDFVASQVPIMHEAATDAGQTDADFERLIAGVCAAPARAFEDLRALLFDATTTLARCNGPIEADAALDRMAGHRFAPLLHHFQLSNWILYARAYARDTSPAAAAVARRFDQSLRASDDAIEWLAGNWLGSTG